MIEVVDLHRWFGSVHAVRGVGFAIPAGQVVGLLGPNGAGKTTTLRMLTGIIKPQKGSIQIAGVDAIAHPAQSRRGFGYLPESAPSYPEMSVTGFLRYRAQILHVPRPSRKTQIARVIEECQLGSVAKRRIGQLSKGYRQRVALAATLLHDPKVLILDEPTNGLDPTQIREARSLIGDLAQNRTVLVSSHILPEIERTCERVIIIGAGKVLADGTPKELCEQNTKGGCIVECKGHLAQISFTLKHALPESDLETTPLEGGWWRIKIQAPEMSDACEAVGEAFGSARIQIRQLRPTVAGLEDVFVRVLEASEGAEA
ncbi:MAG: hypothetical protein COB69_01110 [Phycisphaera sp.]|nr:MAG: hypothetical protein COB69_01110 [Phycisphaera sp.]